MSVALPCLIQQQERVVGDGRVTCFCGRTFQPDFKGQKFCDHECYRNSMRVAIKDRFWSKVNVGHPDECWLWTAKARLARTETFPGYGSIAGVVNGKRRPLYSNRVAWELTNGPIPDGLFVLHTCDVSLCCNPAHLFLGTQATNLEDAREKGRLDETLARTHVLTPQDRLDIFHASREKGSGVMLARRYGVSKTCISVIRKGRFSRNIRPIAHPRANLNNVEPVRVVQLEVRGDVQ